MSSENYVWSAKNNAFYPAAFESDYLAANSWPDDGVAVDDSVFHEYGRTNVPQGKVRGIDADGMPAWIEDVTPVTPAAQYTAAIAAGLVVTCASTPALDGIYAVTPSAMQDIMNEAQHIAAFQKFTSGESTLPWSDAGGDVHTFSDTPTFVAFAKAASKYVAVCVRVCAALDAGNDATFPANSAAID